MFATKHTSQSRALRDKRHVVDASTSKDPPDIDMPEMTEGPQRPPPVVASPQKASRRQSGNGKAKECSHKTEVCAEKAAIPNGHTHSSSTARFNRSNTSETVYEVRYEDVPRSPWASEYDIEKGDRAMDQAGSSDTVTSPQSSIRPATVEYLTDGSDAVEAHDEHLLSTLIYLSLPNFVVPVVFLLYTLLALPVVLLISLFASLNPKNSGCLRSRVNSALSPLLRAHLRIIHTSSSHQALTARQAQSIQLGPTTRSKDGVDSLITVLLFSPFYAVAIAVVAWIAATFWLFAAILGEPGKSSTTDVRGRQDSQKEKDGRAAARSVIGWWRTWCLWGLRG